MLCCSPNVEGGKKKQPNKQKTKQKTKKKPGGHAAGLGVSCIHIVALCDITKMLIPRAAGFSTEQAKEVKDGFRGGFQ